MPGKKTSFIKRAGRYVKKGLKKRYGSWSKPNISQLSKDVAMLKHLVNVEKKKTDVTLSTPTGIGQFADESLATTGVYVTRLTPTINQGIQNNQRTGNSLKLVSAMVNMEFRQQSSCRNNIRLRWYIINVPEEDMGLSNVEVKFMEENPFSGVIDYNSSRNPEFFTQFKVIRSGNVYIKQDAQSNLAYQANVKCPLKLNHHLKYDANDTANSTKNQFYLYVVADRGDVSLNTGVQIQYNTRWYYTDN